METAFVELCDRSLIEPNSKQVCGKEKQNIKYNRYLLHSMLILIVSLFAQPIISMESVEG